MVDPSQSTPGVEIVAQGAESGKTDNNGETVGNRKDASANGRPAGVPAHVVGNRIGQGNSLPAIEKRSGKQRIGALRLFAAPEILQEAVTEFFAMNQGKYPYSMLEDFCAYWTERDANGVMYKLAKQDAFEIPNRLRTWYGNNKAKYDAIAKAESAKVPTMQEVYEFAELKRMPKEWATDFWCKNDASGWMMYGAPIINWKPLMVMHCNKANERAQRP